MIDKVRIYDITCVLSLPAAFICMVIGGIFVPVQGTDWITQTLNHLMYATIYGGAAAAIGGILVLMLPIALDIVEPRKCGCGQVRWHQKDL
jgi:hypothetical protein